MGLSDLNAAQKEAVLSSKDHHVVVIAGAGSGKTRVLTYTMAYLVKKVEVPPDQILLLTFTRRAAQEMLDRAGHLIHSSNSIRGGTFHSFAAWVLRQHGRAIGLPKDFVIIDPADTRSILSSLVKDLAKVNNVAKSSLPRSGTLADMFSTARNMHWPLKATLRRKFPSWTKALPSIKAIAREYTTYKRDRGHADFDDLLSLLVKLLEGHPEVRQRINNQYCRILVDEYQDTNLTQAKILSLLTGEDCQVMVVGDDSQSIYSWRGANFENLFDIAEELPDAKLVKLEQNYRSSQPILDVANALQDQMAQRFRKVLFTDRKDGAVPGVIVADSNYLEAQAVYRRIRRYLHNGGLPHNLAVIYRANRDPVDLEVMLTKGKIPYVKYGGLSFAEAAHVKDTLAVLRCGISRTDEVAAMRVLTLCSGVGRASAEAVWRTERGAPLSNRIGQYLANSNRSWADMEALMRVLMSIHAEGDPAHQMKAIVQFYLALPKIEREMVENKEKDLERLCQIAMRYPGPGAMLQDLTLDPPDKKQKKKEEDRIVLSTIHSAKGMEWDRVFIFHAHDGSIPKQAVHSQKMVSDVEEELRLLYVAVTRARHVLTISFSQAESDISRFLRDIPEDLLEWE